MCIGELVDNLGYVRLVLGDLNAGLGDYSNNIIIKFNQILILQPSI